MGRVDQDQLVVGQSHLDLLLHDLALGIRRFVQPGLAHTQHVGIVEELRHPVHHRAAKFGVVGLFGIDRHPAEMPDAVLGGPWSARIR